MLEVFIPGQERWDEQREIFITTEPVRFHVEHSLVSMSEWEAKYKKPFMSDKDPKTPSEMFDYIYMMRLEKDIKKEDLVNLTPENVREIRNYIDEKRTATTFSKDQTGKPLRETITSELIYAWLVLQNIPFEVESWHVSRILTLINVVAIKNQPPKKESQADAINRARAWKKAKPGRVSKPHIPKP